MRLLILVGIMLGSELANAQSIRALRTEYRDIERVRSAKVEVQPFLLSSASYVISVSMPLSDPRWAHGLIFERTNSPLTIANRKERADMTSVGLMTTFYPQDGAFASGYFVEGRLRYAFGARGSEANILFINAENFRALGVEGLGGYQLHGQNLFGRISVGLRGYHFLAGDPRRDSPTSGPQFFGLAEATVGYSF